jgi:hypothetical protein
VEVVKKNNRYDDESISEEKVNRNGLKVSIKDAEIVKEKEINTVREPESEKKRDSFAMSFSVQERNPSYKSLEVTDSLLKKEQIIIKEPVSAKKTAQPVMRFQKPGTKILTQNEVLPETFSLHEPLPETIASLEEPEVIAEPNRYSEISSRVSLIESALLDVKQALGELLAPIRVGKDPRFSQRKSEDGGVYYGELKNGVKEGRGKLVTPGGDLFEGEWRNNSLHGRARSTWANGDVYVGFFDNNYKSGVGEFIWSNGNHYLGEWRENQMYGIGKHRDYDGREYVGEWVEGNREGMGIMKYKNGNVYEGEFRGGKPNGQGKLTDKSGKSKSGTWENGKFNGS